MKRERGFYFVKFRNSWMIGEYIHSHGERANKTPPYWNLVGFSSDFPEAALDEVNEKRIINPDERDELFNRIDLLDAELVKQMKENYELRNKKNWFQKLFGR